jgi:hypothetical protein
MTRAAMWGLLVVVAAAAAVLSFSALNDLAILCGFHEHLAWLLPVVVDAGAGAGCLVWLAHRPGAGRQFARTLTWVLLTSSVAGNAVVHGLSAYGLAAPWWLVVMVSAIAPAVLGAIVHLSVLVGRTTEEPEVITGELAAIEPDPDRLAELIEQGVGRRRIASVFGISEHQARQLLASRTGDGS